MDSITTLKTEQILIQTHDDVGDAWDEIWRLYDKAMHAANVIGDLDIRSYAISICDRTERAVQNICESKMDDVKCIICPSGSIKDYVNTDIVVEDEWIVYFVADTRYNSFVDAYMLWVTETDVTISREKFKV